MIGPSISRAAPFVVGIAFAGFACAPGGADDGRPFVQTATPEEAGRYLTLLGGCNDCHTDGWVETGGRVPDAERLTGSVVGWLGPWGTTYPPNLRLTVQNMTEEQWITMFRTRTDRPPMPWPNFREKSDRDLIAMYRYIKSLGPRGEPAPTYLPPGGEPQPPYFELVLPQSR